MAKTFEPWYVIVVGARKNSKVTGLPNDTARLGWFLGVLAEAKLARPGGRFASRDQLLEAIGRFGEYVDDYLRARLLEEAPRLCARCRKKVGHVPAGTLVIHDWQVHQRDPGAAARAAEWRAERATNADRTQDERNEYDDQTQDEREPNDSRTPDVTADSRARAKTDTDTETDTGDSYTGQRDSPMSPPSGDHDGRVNPRAAGTNPRARGTSPRQVAKREAEAEAERVAGRRWRAQQRQLACYRGAISDAQLAQMNADDAPLEQLPDWTEYQAAKRQAADEPIWLEGA